MRLALLVYAIIEIGITLVLHFMLGWPVWICLIIASVITTVPSWIAMPVRGALKIVSYIVVRLIGMLPMYILIVVVLYLIGHPSW